MAPTRAPTASPTPPANHDRHLKAHPDNAFAPLFDFFEPWCQDENRHGDIFNVLIGWWRCTASWARAVRRGWSHDHFIAIA
jgi:hypothetical protein